MKDKMRLLVIGFFITMFFMCVSTKARSSEGEAELLIIELVLRGLSEAFKGDSNKIRTVSDPIILFEGNKCSQELVGSLPLTAMQVNFKQHEKWFDNDEARSLAFRLDRQQLNLPYLPGTRIQLFDSPDGKKSNDWIDIEVKNDPVGQYPGGVFCLNHFEQNYEDQNFRVTYHRKNGKLNGKVSFARIISSAPTWRLLPGIAQDIGSGSKYNNVYVIGSSTGSGTGEGNVFKLIGGQVWAVVNGIEGKRIDVDSNGLPWVVKYNGDLFSYSRSEWVKQATNIRDVGIGSDGIIWMVTQSGGIRTKGPDNKWGEVSFSEGQEAWRVDVDGAGIPWVVSKTGELLKLQYSGKAPVKVKWLKEAGLFSDIGCNAGGKEKWAIGISRVFPDGPSIDPGIYKRDNRPKISISGRSSLSSWQLYEGAATRIAVDRLGGAWVVNSEGNIFTLAR